jgi:hypothetical protein
MAKTVIKFPKSPTKPITSRRLQHVAKRMRVRDFPIRLGAALTVTLTVMMTRNWAAP